MTGGVLKRGRPNRRTRLRALRRFADLQRTAALYGPGNPELFPRGICILLAIERGPPGTTDPRRPHRVTPPSPLYLRRLSYLPTHQEVSAPVASVSFPRDVRSPKPDPPSTEVCSAELHHLPRALVEPPLPALPTLQELSGQGTPTNQSPGLPTTPSVTQPIHDSTSREESPSNIVTSPSRAPLHELPADWFILTPEKFSGLPPTPGKWYRPRRAVTSQEISFSPRLDSPTPDRLESPPGTSTSPDDDLLIIPVDVSPEHFSPSPLKSRSTDTTRPTCSRRHLQF